MSFSNDESKNSSQRDLGKASSHEGDEIAELFEDSDNEEFIKALEKAPTAKKERAAPTHLDDIVPDAPQADNDEDQTQSTATKGHFAPSQEKAFQQESLNSNPSMTPLEKVPVSISLELGTVACSLQKLIDLRPSDVLELKQPIGHVIDLKIDGKLVGRGEIVRLGDQLGLRISELADR